MKSNKIMHVQIYVLMRRRKRRNAAVTHSSGSWTLRRL
jgi:hypothetical protein